MFPANFARTPYLVDMHEHDESGLPNYQAAAVNGDMDTHARGARPHIPAKIDDVLEYIHDNSAMQGGRMYVYPYNAHGVHVYDISPGNGTYDAQVNKKRLEASMCSIGTTRITRISLIHDGIRACRLLRTEAGTRSTIAICCRRVECQDTSPDILLRSEQHMQRGANRMDARR